MVFRYITDMWGSFCTEAVGARVGRSEAFTQAEVSGSDVEPTLFTK